MRVVVVDALDLCSIDLSLAGGVLAPRANADIRMFTHNKHTNTL